MLCLPVLVHLLSLIRQSLRYSGGWGNLLYHFVALWGGGEGRKGTMLLPCFWRLSQLSPHFQSLHLTSRIKDVSPDLRRIQLLLGGGMYYASDPIIKLWGKIPLCSLFARILLHVLMFRKFDKLMVQLPNRDRPSQMGQWIIQWPLLPSFQVHRGLVPTPSLYTHSYLTLNGSCW